MASERMQRRIERLLDQIDQAEAQGEWETVRSLAQDVLEVDSGNREAAGYLRSAERRLGAALEGADVSPASTTPGQPTATAPEAERRQLTVMFCDLQGSTALSQQLDPEELRDVIRGYQEVCAGAVGRFEGHIAKYLGDGLLVYFGYPQAHEDDPQRAARAGLAILEDMVPLNARLKADRDLVLTVRIGVHTGLVVAGEMGGGDTLEELAIVGETPNIAARIEGAANPNSLAISDITANLIRGLFVCEPMGAHELKGISERVELFQVLSESDARSRFDVVAHDRLTPLVGREEEVGLLMGRWEQAEEGLGQVVLLSGEAGIGKSRLLYGINDRLEGRAYSRQEYRCSPYHQNSVLHPMIEFLSDWLDFRREDSSDEKLTKVEGRLSEYPVETSEAVPLVAALLSVPLDGRYPQLDLSPQSQRQKTLELLTQVVLGPAVGQPVMAVFEDIQWADPTTLELLGFLVDQTADAHVLSIFTFRPEFTPPWESRSHVTQITLNRLPQSLATGLMARITGGKEFPEEVVAQIAAKSDGVPLFVEELTQMVIESGLLREVDGRYELSEKLTELAIPSTLQDSLTARLDKLGEVKEVVQLASVLGREFIYQLIQAVSHHDDAPLADHLKNLVAGEFLYQQGVIPETNYIFKHALIRDAAYNSLLISRRHQYHQMVAQVYEEKFPETVESQPELVAHHYAEAGLKEKAIYYWQMAGERALGTYAHEEASAHFKRGMTSMGVALEGSEPAEDSTAAELLYGLGRSQVRTAGHSVDKMTEAIGFLKRAFEHYRQAGQRDRALEIAQYPIRPRLGYDFGLSGLVGPAVEMAPQGSIESARLLTTYGVSLGLEEARYAEAQQAFDQALAIAERIGDVSLELNAVSNSANVHFFHSNHVAALQTSLRAIELSAQVDDPRSELFAHYIAFFSQGVTGQSQAAAAHASAMLNLGEKLQDNLWLANGNWVNAITFTKKGDWPAARAFSDTGLLLSPDAATLLANRAVFEYESGEFDEGRRYLDRLVELAGAAPNLPVAEHWSVASTIPLIVRISGERDWIGVAERSAETFLSSLQALPRLAVGAQMGLALLAVVRGDRADCERWYDQFLSYEWISSHTIVTDRLFGLLSGTTGNLDRAAEHFAISLNFCSKAGDRPELAWTCCDYADMLLERNQAGDREKALSLLEESLAISSELGMRPLMERARSRQEIPGA